MDPCEKVVGDICVMDDQITETSSNAFENVEFDSSLGINKTEIERADKVKRSAKPDRSSENKAWIEHVLGAKQFWLAILMLE